MSFPLSRALKVPRRWLGPNFLSRVRRACRQARARALYRYVPIRQQVLYESYYGASATDSPRAIFDQLIDDPQYRRLRHVWVLNGTQAAPQFVEQYRNHRRVSFVSHGSRVYARELVRSRWLITNATFAASFVKRPGQVYVNTWHGTPLKTMGFDMPNGALEAGNTVRNFLLADYLVSANSHMTDVMYRDAYRLDGIFGGEILEVGYPRVDVSVALAQDPVQTRSALGSYGVALPEDRTIVLYAPTWKGKSYHRPANDAEDMADVVMQLQRKLGDSYFVIVKPHQRVASHSNQLAELTGRLIPPNVPANVALAGADVLVSDYSSIFFDFLSLDRPVVFYVPDADEYDDDRGRYLSDDELPGPSCATIDDLAQAITSPSPTYQARRLTAKERFAPWEDGRATQRVIDKVFAGVEPELGRVVRFENNRPRMLIYLGGLLRNGISSSALNMLHELDYDRFDVSVDYGTPRSDEAKEILSGVDSRARLLETPPGRAERYSATLLRRRQGWVLPARALKSKEQVREAFGTEYRRRYGDVSFDYVIDFSGYSPRPAVVHLASPPAVHSIWLHNDLVADSMRTINGVRPHFQNLNQVRSLYPLHDRLVSVSPALNRINHKSFGQEVPADRFVSARNFIAGERLTRLAAAEDAHITELAQPGLSNRTRRARENFFAIAPGTTVFVAVGRVSPEKNYARLVDAFSILAKSDKDSHLVVVGDGALRRDLVATVMLMGLDDRVHFVGSTPNPFAYMARATCLVMSSDYEGQPMVILEARVLGLPVVSTKFDSLESALPPGAGVVVEREAAALAVGMQKHIDGEVPAERLDYKAYNRECLAEFYHAIGAE